MGPMNAYKDMLDNVVSPIICVVMNHQNQLEQMANGAMFATRNYHKCSTRLPSHDLCVDFYCVNDYFESFLYSQCSVPRVSFGQHLHWFITKNLGIHIWRLITCLSSKCKVTNITEKVYLPPQPMKNVTHHPLTYENGFFWPLNFLKHDKSPPEVVLKNHSKSKNHKMKNQIALDFKLVVLRSEHTIWNALVYIFCCNFRSMLFSIIIKNVLNIPYYMYSF
jgi:hypothetical protein